MIFCLDSGCRSSKCSKRGHVPRHWHLCHWVPQFTICCYRLFPIPLALAAASLPSTLDFSMRLSIIALDSFHSYNLRHHLHHSPSRPSLLCHRSGHLLLCPRLGPNPVHKHPNPFAWWTKMSKPVPPQNLAFPPDLCSMPPQIHQTPLWNRGLSHILTPTRGKSWQALFD